MARINKQNSPSTVESWVEYYKALENNPHKKFRGCCSRKIFNSNNTKKKFDTWTPIEAYFQYKGNSYDSDYLKEHHPWSVPKRRYWNEKIGRQLIDEKRLENPKWLNYDKELLTPHHLISCSVTESINRHWQKIIENHIGYNVNSAHNLVILTNSAVVACHLEIPLHEGTHIKGRIKDYISIDEYNKYAQETATSKKGLEVEFWNMIDKNTNKSEAAKYTGDDTDESKIVKHLNQQMKFKAYHSKVFKYVTKVLEKYFKNCPKDLNDTYFINDMNKCSKLILLKLQNFKWVLHTTGEDYKPGSKKGCCGVEVISTYVPNKNHKDKEIRMLHNKTEGEIAKQNGMALKSCPNNRKHPYLQLLFTKKKCINRKELGLLVATEIDY